MEETVIELVVMGVGCTVVGMAVFSAIQEVAVFIASVILHQKGSIALFPTGIAFAIGLTMILTVFLI